MAKAFGIVTSTPRRVNVYGLQDCRPAGAFSFLGRYRVIDFPISNLTNSGIENIQVYLNKFPRSLTDHLGTGRQYNINSKNGRLQLLFCNHNNHNEVYNTDVSDYLDNMDYLNLIDQEYVVIQPCYMIFKQDFADILEEHIQSGADISMLYHKVNNGRDHFLSCRVVTVDKDQKITSLSENRGNRASQSIFMDSYVMKKDLFVDLVRKARDYSSTFSLAQMISKECEEQNLNIRGIQHKGYFAAICDLQSYYDASIELLDMKVARSLFSDDWPIYTRTTDSCPTQVFEGANIYHSLVSDGCEIEGTVANSVIGRGVKIGRDAVVKNSVVLSYSEIGPGVHMEYQIVDKWAKVLKTKELIARPDDPGYVKTADRL
jgi:glucose-1-phosphate adenylyltransferase